MHVYWQDSQQHLIFPAHRGGADQMFVFFVTGPSFCLAWICDLRPSLGAGDGVSRWSSQLQNTLVWKRIPAYGVLFRDIGSTTCLITTVTRSVIGNRTNSWQFPVRCVPPHNPHWSVVTLDLGGERRGGDAGRPARSDRFIVPLAASRLRSIVCVNDRPIHHLMRR